MQFKNIEKIHEGKYLTRYDIQYQTETGRTKTYEIISRKHNITSFEQLHDSHIDAVVMILHDSTGQKILLNHEFRMAPGEWAYNFPAGLIDAGEDPAQAAARELFEETGLKLDKIDDIWKESYSAIGFCDEKTVVVTGTASGDFLPSNSDVEEIHAAWYTKEQVRELLKTHRFASRTQCYCKLWAKE